MEVPQEEIFGELGVAADQVLTNLPADVRWPHTLLGQRVRTTKGRNGGQWNYEPRLTVACLNPSHECCSKSRSVTMDTAALGRLAPVYFLGAWLQRGEMTQAEHRRYMPGWKEMKAFADSSEA